ncbi:hypothetical protein HanHA300_Chr09g0321101 [Helianthus annuus]|nr:hypothetical protein HanHA300_Chr09g0321101 [Helianthus annuus]
MDWLLPLLFPFEDCPCSTRLAFTVSGPSTFFRATLLSSSIRRRTTRSSMVISFRLCLR